MFYLPQNVFYRPQNTFYRGYNRQPTNPQPETTLVPCALHTTFDDPDDDPFRFDEPDDNPPFPPPRHASPPFGKRKTKQGWMERGDRGKQWRGEERDGPGEWAGECGWGWVSGCVVGEGR